MINTTLTCIDLFSGIGGISLALHPFVKTTLYCEIDTFCQKLLTQKMQQGTLDKAPIHTDVSTLQLSPHAVPNMICGGYPCQDISSMGLQKGINPNTRSGLFLEIMRLVDENPAISILFLENVANITKCGMKEVVHELSRRGFTFAWKMMSAGYLGAPHQRNRWFCLAVRNDFDLGIINTEVTDNSIMTGWGECPFPRVAFKPAFRQDDNYEQNWSLRCQALGNSVVPVAVRKAFVDLVKLVRIKDNIIDCFQDYRIELSTLNYPYPESGMVNDNLFFNLPNQVSGAYNTITTTIVFGKDTIIMERLPTPRKGITYASSLTERSMKDLPTLLAYCEETKEYLKQVGVEVFPDKIHTILTANVNFVEWMMGYPKDYTLVHNIQPPPKEVDDEPKRARVVDREPRTKEFRYNGMHVFMKDNPNKSIIEISKLWKNVTPEEKKVYSERAKQGFSMRT